MWGKEEGREGGRRERMSERVSALSCYANGKRYEGHR